MTSLAVAKLIIDGLLLISLIFVAFRVLGRQQPGTIANLAKLKELESSLKEVVRDADDAGRSLSDELLGRKRDLEKLLSEVEGVEVRFNKSKNSTEELIENASLIEKRLQSLLIKATDSISTQEQAFSRLNTAPSVRHNSADSHLNTFVDLSEDKKRYEQLSKLGREVFGSNALEQYNNIAEPPSFSSQIQNQKSLREQIEVGHNNYASETFDKTNVPRSQPSQNQFSRDSLPAENSERQIRKDPRLGVLGALSRDSNLF